MSASSEGPHQGGKSASASDRVIIFDTTMRDGEQSPGASMSLDEKLELAKILEDMRVDVIEAGFPIASNGDFEAVRRVAEIVTESTVCGLARAGAKDIERCGEAVRPAKRGRIHTFLSTSPVHMKWKLNKQPHEVLELVTSSVTLARNLCGDVEWSAEDATRTERDFLRRCVEAAIKAGAQTINIPDTVGYSYPEEYTEIFRDLIENVPGADGVIFSTHCHNDLGLAVANSLAGVQGGARQIECAVNGLGERAGNAALEEVVMALKVRADRLPYRTGVISEHITRASRYVSAITGFPVQYNKAIVGKNAFAHESGIHQDGMLKHAETYEIMRPQDVGQGATNLVMGKHSGRHAFREKLTALGYELGANALDEAFARFKDLADKKKHVYDEDIIALVDDSLASGAAHRRQAPARDRRHRGPVGRSDPDRRRRGERRLLHRRRPGGRGVQRHPPDRAARGEPAPVPGARRHRGHRRPGPGLGPAGRRRPHRHRPRRRHRHPHRRRQGLRQRAQQPAPAPGKTAPEPLIASGF